MSARPDVGGRDLLIAAALQAFAEEGIDAVSIRAVNRAAGVGPATVHYHFGTKDGLLDAVLAHHGDEVVAGVIEEARRLLDQGSATPAEVVRSLTHPYEEMLRAHRESGLRWVKVIDQLLRRDRDRVSDPETTRIRSEVARMAFPYADEADIDRAIVTSMQLFVTQVAQLPAESVATTQALEDTLADLEFLTDFLAGGLHAALSRGPAF
ncbi:TetR/AcrR family transcriptional regulator [Nocardioides sp. GXZ039]|uniref:TetR/AcrR family transcriptional regulator n=1 Tax=Nocardioides sp. GXZ039 TaxID=3136018 RepID=UPI0030F3B200